MTEMDQINQIHSVFTAENFACPPDGEAVCDCDNNPDFVPPPFEVDVLIEIRELLKCVLAELEK